MKLCWRDIRPSFLKYNPKTTAIPEIIPVVLICTAGIILSRPDASLSCSFLPQGLFCPGRMHLYLALLLHRDYFAPVGCISIFLFCFTGIISTGRMHPQLALLFHRDYFGQPNASLSCFFLPQGLFRPAECISILLFSSTGIISAARIHLYLALFFHRDYFGRSDASLSCSFSPQGLFPPPGFIPSLLFCSTGMILPQSDASLSSSFAPQG